MTNKIYVSLILIFMTGTLLNDNNLFAQSWQERYALIPQPVSINPGNKSFALTAQTRIVLIGEGNKPDAELFNTYLDLHYGFRLKVTSSKQEQTGALNIRKLNDTTNLHTDSYKLIVDTSKIVLESGPGSGVFYGIQTLIQLLPAGKVSRLDIQSVKIEDYPRYKWRGMHLDVCRHYFPKEFIKKYLDNLALYKMNVFHWHLTEDQGWRIEIKKYPKLQEVSAYRNGTLIGHYSEIPERYDSVRYGGYYTQDDIKEIVAYAKQRHILIVPEIELPGHALAALAAYPELSCTGGSFEVGKKWGVFQDVYCPKEETFTFLQNVLTEVCALFPGPYIHIGGDECPKDRWKSCAHCQALMKREGLKDEHELQSYFVQRIGKFLHTKGKKIIGWDEILEGGLAPDATVMSWRGSRGGIEAARLNHDVVMSPTGYCYFDSYQSRSPAEPLAIGGYIPLEKVYQFEPAPEELSPEEKKHILGGQGNMWTEYIPDYRHVEYMANPRMSAMAEALWSPAEKRSYDSFTTRLTSHFKLLDFLKIGYSKAVYDIDFSVFPTTENRGIEVELKTGYSRGKIYYSTDGSEASLQSIQYKDKIKFDQSTGIKASVFDGGTRRGNSFLQLFQLNLASGKNVILVNPPDEEYPRGGGFSLVNGVIGKLPWVGSDWLGFRGTNLEAIVDLGMELSYSRVGLDLLRDDASSILLPKSIEVQKSDDGKNWTKVTKLDTGEIMTNQRLAILHVGEVRSRWIKIIAENAGVIPDGKPGAGKDAWLFVDEIIVE